LKSTVIAIKQKQEIPLCIQDKLKHHETEETVLFNMQNTKQSECGTDKFAKVVLERPSWNTGLPKQYSALF
jgi:hypothetical protein